MESGNDAGPVTVTHADGTTDTQPAYTTAGLARIARKAAKQPRTWDETNSDHGGGHDFRERS